MAQRNKSRVPPDPAETAARPTRLADPRALPRFSAVDICSYVLALVSLWLVLHLKLLSGLLAGLLVYQVIFMMVPLIETALPGKRARWLAVMLVSVIIIGALSGAILGTISHFRHDVPSVQKLLDQLMQFFDQARAKLPLWAAEYLPGDTSEIRQKIIGWMQTHGGQLQESGRDAARGIAHILIGMILGAIIAVGTQHKVYRRPLAAALVARVNSLADAFRRIVFAQMKISAINAAFTALFLLAVLPLFGTRLPLSKTIVIVAFIVGLLPVVGNLISNTLIVVIALSVGLPVALASLVFLMVIHKLEYFLNAHIIGGEIEASAWELLVAMLVMEAAFGIFGLIAAPIYYAYVKRELIMLRLV
jgi:predicted PurR-regulated permease PerM